MMKEVGWYLLWSWEDHRGIVDTELMDICDVVQESRVKVKLLVVMYDYYGIVIPSLIGS